MLPVAKTVVHNARVLSVLREQQPTTVQSGTGADVQTVVVNGKMTALVVAIPREAQELLEFAIDNGTVRVALLSAQLDNHPNAAVAPSLGMTWNDLVALVRMQRGLHSATGLPTDVMGPGAFAVEGQRRERGHTDGPPTSTANTVFSTATATPKP